MKERKDGRGQLCEYDYGISFTASVQDLHTKSSNSGVMCLNYKHKREHYDPCSQGQSSYDSMSQNPYRDRKAVIFPWEM